MLRSAPVAAHRLLVAAAVLLAVGALGCSDRACFRVPRSTAQCPSASGAKDHFGDCSNIESIDSGGALVAGNLCCYDVTHSLDGIPGGAMGCPTGGGGSSRSSSGDVSPGSEVATSSGVGGMHGSTTSSSTGTSGGGGAGGAQPCDLQTCGFNKEQPLTGCLACSEAMGCSTEAAACDVDASCRNYKTCVDVCAEGDASCLAACQTLYPGGAALFGAFLQCAACGVCAITCAASPVMTLASCGGAGGAGGGSGGTSVGGAGVGGTGGTPTP